ncbi:MAG TPA: serine/threonine-protein kinase [Gemmatimonadaceae bacterium]|nr:serine/threonine-protein kinase [Gemmatimonadaceae bacterium]
MLQTSVRTGEREWTRAKAYLLEMLALKVLRRGLDTADVVRRFLTDRQILSSLSHPNIARLLDGGSTPDGRPYLVMEFVDGAPITAWADARRLDVGARLALFLQVADAVHAAHRLLVVHRDIKPSNVLVDTDGNVKLLDFGIAKLLEDDAEQTQVGSRAMTPDYASPEQLSGDVVTTATDVYQLGLLLRELLTGVRGLAGSRHGDDAPVRASRFAIRTVQHATPPVQRAAARGTTPDRLRRALAGDLDIIVAKALRPEPEGRYASADGMASDVREGLALRRSLHGELHTATAASLSDLALATEPVDPVVADSLMQRAVEILDAVLGRRHATTLVVWMARRSWDSAAVVAVHVS